MKSHLRDIELLSILIKKDVMYKTNKADDKGKEFFKYISIEFV